MDQTWAGIRAASDEDIHLRFLSSFFTITSSKMGLLYRYDPNWEHHHQSFPSWIKENRIIESSPGTEIRGWLLISTSSPWWSPSNSLGRFCKN